MNSKKNKEHDNFLNTHFKPLEIDVEEEGNFEKAFRNFKMLVQKEKILALYKLHQRYEKPSDKKRRKQKEMAQKRLELESKMKKILSGEYEKEKEKRERQKELQKIKRRAGDLDG